MYSKWIDNNMCNKYRTLRPYTATGQRSRPWDQLDTYVAIALKYCR